MRRLWLLKCLVAFIAGTILTDVLNAFLMYYKHWDYEEFLIRPAFIPLGATVILLGILWILLYNPKEAK